MPSIRKTISGELTKAAYLNPNVTALTADLAGSVGFQEIKEKLPKQFVQCGIAEQEMLSLAAGIALSGGIPFAASYAAFHPGRNWDQLRTSVCYNLTPVRLISSHYGLSVGGDGATHQCLEYLALTLCLPNLRVLVPGNTPTAKWALQEALGEHRYPTVIFQPRETHEEDLDEIDATEVHELGYAYLSPSIETKTLLISTGLITQEALALYREKSATYGLAMLVDLTSLARADLAKLIHRYERVVIVEEHQEFGGLGSLLFALMAEYRLARVVVHCCINHRFGKSARAGKDLWSTYEIDRLSIARRLGE